MSLKSIRDEFGVPAWKGSTVQVDGRLGRIVTSYGSNMIRVRMDAHPHGPCVIVRADSERLEFCEAESAQEWILEQSFRGINTGMVKAATAAEAERIANLPGADIETCPLEPRPSSRWYVVGKAKR